MNDSFYFFDSGYVRYEPLELLMTTTGLKEPFMGARAHLVKLRRVEPMRFFNFEFMTRPSSKASLSGTYSIGCVIRAVRKQVSSLLETAGSVEAFCLRRLHHLPFLYAVGNHPAPPPRHFEFGIRLYGAIPRLRLVQFSPSHRYILLA